MAIELNELAKQLEESLQIVNKLNEGATVTENTLEQKVMSNETLFLSVMKSLIQETVRDVIAEQIKSEFKKLEKEIQTKIEESISEMDADVVWELIEYKVEQCVDEKVSEIDLRDEIEDCLKGSTDDLVDVVEQNVCDKIRQALRK
jgi:hypothetical protein